MDANVLECRGKQSRQLISFLPTSEIRDWYQNFPLKSRGYVLKKVIQEGIRQLEEEPSTDEVLNELIRTVDSQSQRIEQLESNQSVLHNLVLQLVTTG